ncbi:NepR family anti-sigma factor [Leisingera daeponensis]|uniref:NepR family anti-sigma factor n=1 Tax=Leisingera daeponensis TaxID=405746 RepID=UPI0021BD8059|nr:NepR family anti-sigma factor [Leisingera daeponensis]
MELYALQRVWFQKQRKNLMDRMTQLPRARPRKEQADREIDENLKRAFEKVASEPVPDRFTDLLKQLKEKEAKSRAQQSGEHTSND